MHPGQRWVWHTRPRFILPLWEHASAGAAQRYVRLAQSRRTARMWRSTPAPQPCERATGQVSAFPRPTAPRSRPCRQQSELRRLGENEPYTIALLIKGRSGGASTKHLYRSGTSSTADHILWLSSGTTPNLRHQASGGGTVTITSVRRDRERYDLVDDRRDTGDQDASSSTWTAGRAPPARRRRPTPAPLFGIYRWGWGFSTNQDFNGDIALIACFASSWTPAMVRRWHADPSASCAHGTRCLRSWGVRHPPRPPRPARAWSPS